MKTKTVGLYLKVSEDEKKMVDELRDKYAVNISQAFRLFLRSMIESKRIGK
jgi:antitoxin component of RelBE/YafQ-DinJ toxin-antitoxin module